MNQLGITKQMISQIRESITTETPADAYVPLPDMGGYFVSQTKQETQGYQFMFSTDVDGRSVHIYIRI
ncbi:hypothetical protein A2765_04860 [Candidatus Kaiserbacteria bacterium RIFCSPHIGHO2_01_FULL_56_24]|uniref:Uncharacterized protein n=1 Tax=Candidatus Kaiserbacteria bacterium RIFCSPHIGHO2_01_FULL_56_24 TaxID=1798487 RepID=A0A1F6DFU3_9BACT|nr:MAG: hypothetical protein A2765_04860 [Candidatus Kaiserbacteria bacterium RIFCSPHIGHO2_01_FULL_56_24]